ncbi:MAG TPA: DMT family transporter [Candidatus Cloacimonadota bacterium]|nr:DMT family transporter [Candidatus Cloacimonadota bacterium]HPT72926.1 DMT family transporter [Candidatus Cloacimonadota bacterium]
MSKKINSILLLFLTSIIWGFAFVAQRKGMESLDPMTFNGIRFAIGAVVVGLLYRWNPATDEKTPFPWLPGIILFIAASLQQIGIVWTTAGNAGFITGLYVVFVPILGLLIGQRLRFLNLVAVFISVIGIYLISVKHNFSINIGDLIVLISAFFWAFHVQVIGRYTKKTSSIYLAFSQYAVCAIGSLIAGFIYLLWKQPEAISNLSIFASIYDAGIPIIYGGLFSVGIAYTLQVEAQKHIDPTTSVLILCLESVFAMFGGWLLLHELVSFKMLIGAFLMLTAMVISSLAYARKE